MCMYVYKLFIVGTYEKKQNTIDKLCDICTKAKLKQPYQSWKFLLRSTKY